MTKTRPAAKATATSSRAAKNAAAQGEAQGTERRRRTLRWTAAIAAAAAVTGGLYAVFSSSSSSAGSGKATYQAGTPGIGATAPGFALAASTGKKISLAGYHGKTVLLYFQEGLTCQPCWDQMTDLEKDAAKVKAAGVDQILSVTSDPADLITRKTKDMKLSTPVLSDPDLAVSKQYDANSYGMMGTSRDGHTFVLVGPDGKIKWRADYGGAPKYTMYVAPDKLLADLKAGEAK
ncbi:MULTISPECIES: peroxiredoxin family protein [Streptomycetaceae]|uniref:Alkyl hydroperoxide reductase/ Thiol specific antioxidant/ Mal allergen n=1 Tax=Streptantibioticus cattleyicolor (strain ATCC 35852 / DSM 46488 / JCM 4925 / NBRC 14057 / NRRL 8057) TaxID=1003195 RepID=F8K4F9_STREN|nr:MULTISPECIES: peroxiredoxin family protein [Streptomycetaceae]AEW95113.1 alkyl hydroperoxide reductase/ Thiol specific antioxidant/ Mal allergen [Streptantibioticus cattleyicolor NRRL 8057 = DSM 46488]MYS59702.1 redoxin domain-containing protein [Streptomyces sp. SID5468]CCB75460.1 Alkyl hydroperoxide reductase/ Thiol specific antioxidant/ Mal allergen [Streptantibioticus cattleyicolor NRRL 8057 = DSM 46488]